MKITTATAALNMFVIGFALMCAQGACDGELEMVWEVEGTLPLTVHRSIAAGDVPDGYILSTIEVFCSRTDAVSIAGSGPSGASFSVLYTPTVAISLVHENDDGVLPAPTDAFVSEGGSPEAQLFSGEFPEGPEGVATVEELDAFEFPSQLHMMSAGGIAWANKQVSYGRDVSFRFEYEKIVEHGGFVSVEETVETAVVFEIRTTFRPKIPGSITYSCALPGSIELGGFEENEDHSASHESPRELNGLDSARASFALTCYKPTGEHAWNGPREGVTFTAVQAKLWLSYAFSLDGTTTEAGAFQYRMSSEASCGGWTKNYPDEFRSGGVAPYSVHWYDHVTFPAETFNFPVRAVQEQQRYFDLEENLQFRFDGKAEWKLVIKPSGLEDFYEFFGGIWFWSEITVEYYR
mmetsp:Transcript_10161/g.21293  ORF Transcript_10161/g.21293 Transcript_10161/m.21293 type:complete len:407 (-) Transcript_10161:243-1463(-)